MRKILGLLVFVTTFTTWATPTITSVTAQQRDSGRIGLVDISVALSGDPEDVAQADYWFIASNCTTHAAIPVLHVTSEDSDSDGGSTCTRHFVWDTTADLGNFRITEIELTVEVAQRPGGVQLWANGPYWAKCNVGATKPEECGYHFWWGDTVGYRYEGNAWNAVDGSQNDYSFSAENCPTYGKSVTELKSLDYIDSMGNLTAEHDAATVHLGDGWHLPTAAEFEALSNNCTTVWTTRNGVYGRLVMGKGIYASKSIFLPCTGRGNSGTNEYSDNGYYWSSSIDPDTSSKAWYLFGASSSFYGLYNFRYQGCSVRPLREFSGGEVAFMSSIASTHLTVNTFPKVTDVRAQQRYPWNGKVDISYTVSDDIDGYALTNGLFASLKVTATDMVANTAYTATIAALSGETTLTAGNHAIVWDFDQQEIDLKSTNVVFNVSCETNAALYCVIDLSRGTNTTSYPVIYLPEEPSGGFTNDIYRTTKLVLRRINAGSFIMGDDQTNESHRVTLTKPFYMGIFEVTQKQWSLVTGWLPDLLDYYGSANDYPVYRVSYESIRGRSGTVATSFLGKLQARTKLNFNLPTEAQWEYACRAGTTTTYYWGSMMDGDYEWYKSNSGSKMHPVGTRKPNAWGLYDMSGNVSEWCLDYDGKLAYGTDPKGPSSSFYSYRVIRGGCWDHDESSCTSTNRFRFMSGDRSNNNLGFRISRSLP